MKINSSANGTEITIAWILRNTRISYAVLFILSNSPGNPPPKVIEIKFDRTANVIINGIDECLNQLFASIDEEFKIKIFPTAAKADPIKHNKIEFSCRNVLSQTPATTSTPPITHPIFIPYLSRIQLAGNAKIG